MFCLKQDYAVHNMKPFSLMNNSKLSSFVIICHHNLCCSLNLIDFSN